MPTKPTRRQIAGPKADYAEWAQAAELLDRIRRRPGWSWRSVAKALGHNDGWATAAARYRGNMGPADVRAIHRLYQSLLAEDAAAAKTDTSSTTPSTPEKEEDTMPRGTYSAEAKNRLKRESLEAGAALAHLMDNLGWSPEELARRLDYKNKSVFLQSYRKMRDGRMTRLANRRKEAIRACLEEASVKSFDDRPQPAAPLAFHDAFDAPIRAQAAMEAAERAKGPVVSDDFDIGRVRETLFALAADVEAAGANVGPFFRAPYTQLKEELLALAAKLTV